VKQGTIKSLKISSHVILTLLVLLQKKPRWKSSKFSSWY